jgi:hypothetical protein
MSSTSEEEKSISRKYFAQFSYFPSSPRFDSTGAAEAKNQQRNHSYISFLFRRRHRLRRRTTKINKFSEKFASTSSTLLFFVVFLAISEEMKNSK